MEPVLPEEAVVAEPSFVNRAEIVEDSGPAVELLAAFSMLAVVILFELWAAGTVELLALVASEMSDISVG